ncbi:hypothetical protein [Persephonella sp. KM09-Lau-8]|uniref:hypothetical protein n=1 Tax=Persephonella sp. KM09-Lau-8 TaxID=1158345 RepID=UPI0012DC04B5|nr:hypothetical protein [Persephonella sp. KM09-Lau-8]
MFKKLVAIILLIGFSFNVFHEFVFYKIDPCMQKVESLKSFYNAHEDNDPLCEIHQNLHLKYLFVENFEIKEIKFSEKHIPILPDLNPKDTPQEIFKPPTLS